MDFSIESLIGIALGIGLAAATGFRIFIPLLLVGLAARFDMLPLGDGFQWLATTPALLTLGTAAVLETLGYYIPGVDHALDVLAGPATLLAGIVASAAVMTEVPPAVLWPVAVIARGGAAGLTKGSTALLRAKSGVATGGGATSGAGPWGRARASRWTSSTRTPRRWATASRPGTSRIPGGWARR